MGDVIDSTLLHINNLSIPIPIPIPIPIHQRGLISNIVDYYEPNKITTRFSRSGSDVTGRH